ncbi:LuxR family two component transcriptional regulator [Labedella gwakjiensis]|uniref:LuxR family two component transcriptional regulator n=1 Tax=Labedella gwakjiensis TaxID=390269 RepID=A0A2P8GT54_9MICO|nr:response regulator transcription factor [Labedella gwakjiensis]PSL37158.1 LuxR family two component transcriptional regulator [Labedella gwakjiensis]RUQ81943.1 response regulator transcription factor [Labedella gwakjiensis]
MTTVFLIDDHEVVRQGIAGLIGREPDLDVVGEAATAREGRQRVAATLPDVAVIDVRLPDGNGIDLCRDIRSAHPEVHCLILTAYDDDDAMYAAAIAGAAGYVLKDIRGQKLVESIRAVAAGIRLMDPQVRRSVVTESAPPSDRVEVALSLRERQVLDHIADGLTNRQIGEKLGLAEKTVKNYVSSLLDKLGMERRTQAAVYGAEHRAD